jgi:hypothetical protein
VDTTGSFPGRCDNYHSRLSFKRVTDKNATFAEWFALSSSSPSFSQRRAELMTTNERVSLIRSSEFDGDEATVATVEQTLEQGVYTNGFNLLRKAIADKTN